MVKTIRYILFLFVLSNGYVIFSQVKDAPMVSSGNLLYYLDFTSFKGKANESYVEFNVMIYADQLTINKQEDSSYSELNISFILKDSEGSQIISRGWSTQVSLDTESDIRTQVVYDEWGELLKPANYMVHLQIEDDLSAKTGIIEDELTIPLFNIDQLEISAIKFLNGIKKNENENVNIQILNPARRYGLLNQQLSFYLEIYCDENLLNKKIIPTYNIWKINQNFTKNISDNPITLKSVSLGITRALDISNLETGIYELTVELRSVDSAAVLCKQARSFEIIQADYFANLPRVDEKKLNTLSDLLSYLATPKELNIFNDLDQSSRTAYLVEFYRELDPTPENIENEYLIDLLTRYAYANENYNWSKTEGWATDRGRILIQNGFPDEVERFEFEENSNPYEIWYYRQNRQLLFVFGDLYMNGNYVLLHSNKESEVYNPSWKLQLNGI